MPPAEVAHSTELRYMTFNRSIHPELYEADRIRILEAFGFDARLSIFPAGHVIQFRANEITFSEFVGPRLAAVQMPRLGMLEDIRIVTKGHFAPKVKNEIVYQSDVQARKCTEGEYERSHRELAQQDELNVMKFFQAEQAPHGLAPFSLIRFEASAFRLETMAVHAFPCERVFIWVESVFECAWADREV